MAAMKIEQLTVGAKVWMIDAGNVSTACTVVAVKKRNASKPQVCVETASALAVYEYFPERFFPSEQESWFAVAMFAQRSAQQAMTDADNAFKKAGTAAPEEPVVTA
jgi:hypothetical protein